MSGKKLIFLLINVLNENSEKEKILSYFHFFLKSCSELSELSPYSVSIRISTEQGFLGIGNESRRLSRKHEQAELGVPHSEIKVELD